METARRCSGFAALALGACTTLPTAVDTVPVELRAAVPAELAAALCAQLVRASLPAADPLPYHAGAPLSRRPDGTWLIRYDQRPDGRWIAVADRRASLQFRPAAATRPTVRWELASDLTGSGHGCMASFTLTIGADQRTDHCSVRGRLGGVAAGDVERRLGRALAMAEALWAGCANAGRAVANAEQLADNDADRTLAPWQALLWLQIAEQRLATRDRRGAATAMATANRLMPCWASAARRSSDLWFALGDDARAVTALDRSAAIDTDPTSLATAMRLRAAADHRIQGGHPGDSLRAAAAARLRAMDFEAAASLLGRAASTDPSPCEDLRLLQELHRSRGDRERELAALLLLREYSPEHVDRQTLANALRANGQAGLAMRAAERPGATRPEPQVALAHRIPAAVAAIAAAATALLRQLPPAAMPAR